MRRITQILIIVLVVCAVRIAWQVFIADTLDRDTVTVSVGTMWGALILWGGATWELRYTSEENRR